jgi:hypothetical protein
MICHYEDNYPLELDIRFWCMQANLFLAIGILILGSNLKTLLVFNLEISSVPFYN